VLSGMDSVMDGAAYLNSRPLIPGAALRGSSVAFRYARARMSEPRESSESSELQPPDEGSLRALRDEGRPVVVTGGAGYIGSHTLRSLVDCGVRCIAIDDLSTGHPEACLAALEQIDLGDLAALHALFVRERPWAVMHFAARTYVGESMTDPSRYYRQNVINTWNLLDAMRASGCQTIVFSSSCATYGEPRELPLTEAHPQLPISPYGKTKLHMEHMLADYSLAYGIRYAALRYFNAAGASRDARLGEHHDPETHLIPLVLQVAAGKRDHIQVFGDDYETPDGTCVRDYVHVEDLADAHLRALARLRAGERRLECNLGTGQGYSVREVIEVARRVTGRPIEVRVAPRREGDPPILVAGGDRSRKLLGWKPARAAIEDIVSDAWAFMEAHPRGFSR